MRGMSPRVRTPSGRSIVGRRLVQLKRRTGDEVRRLRNDVNLTQTQVAAAAGLAQSTVSSIERGLVLPTLPALEAIAGALGADLSIRLYPNTGPTIHDRTQAAILQALLGCVGAPWRRFLEVPVHRPARGVIDLVLYDPSAALFVAVGVESRIARLEQQIRWAAEKAESLPSTELWRMAAAERDPRVSRLLVLRSTRAHRTTVATFDEVVRAAYPGTVASALAALQGRTAWPGPTLLWADVESGRAAIRERPPNAVTVGRAATSEHPTGPGT